MSKIHLLLAIFLFCTSASHAQDTTKVKEFKNLSSIADFLGVSLTPDTLKGIDIARNDISMKTYALDTAADAVVLSDIGQLKMAYGGQIYFNRTKQTKILKQKGANEQGTFSLTLNVDYESLTYLSARVIQPDSSVIYLKEKDIFFEKISDDRFAVKVVYPNLKEGSITEIRYKMMVAALNLVKWSFQDVIPVRFSMIEMDMPDWIEFQYLFKGFLNVKSGTVKKKSFGQETMIPVLLMDSVPAFREEKYMRSKKDLLCGVSFNWSKIGKEGSKNEISNSYEFMGKQLLESKKFGVQFQKKSNYNDVWKAVKPLLIQAKTSEDTLKTVYDFVCKRINWIDNFFSPFVEKTLESTLKKGNGNSGEMNLMMVACLREAGFSCFPLMISTFDNGTPSSEHLSIYQFDHVLCYVKIKEKEYFLDAGNTFRNIYLPRRVSLNGSGWIVDKKNSRWIDLPKPLSNLTINSNLTLEKDGVVKGQITNIYEGYSAVDERENLNKDKKKEFVKQEFSEHFTDFKLLSTDYENTDSLYEPLKRKVTCEIVDAATIVDSILFINPANFGKISPISFNGDERIHPVQFNYPTREKYILNLTLPENYKIEELPPSFNSTLGVDDATFTFKSSKQGNMIQISVNFYLKKLNYSKSEFKNIQLFFNNIIKKNNERIVLKKK